MKRWINSPILLLQLPFAIRIAILVLAFLLCLATAILSMPFTHNAEIVVIPVAVAAWFFGYRGMLLCVLMTMIIMMLVAVFMQHISFNSLRPNLVASIGIVILIAIGFMVAYLRSMIDIIEAARLKATLAEEQLQAAYEQQQQLLEQKDLFLTNINHEFRSPLTILYGSLEMLKQAWGDNPPFLDELQKTWFKRAVDSCDNLMVLTNQTLSAIYVNHEVPAPHFEVVPVAPVIRDLLDSGDPRLRRSCTFSLDIAEQAMVWADRDFLSQILWNVLTNASLYSPPETTVTIDAAPFESSSSTDGVRSQLCIHIKDEGSGIPPEEIPYLFSPFVRLKRDVAKSLPGSGLGLYISKRLAEAMDGRIWVESSGKPGEGSCFCLLLPTAAPMPALQV